MVDRMIVKMCRDNVCRHIIRRMLHRCEGIDILPVRQYDDSSRMLPGAPPDPGTPFHDPLNLTLSLSASMLLIIIFYKSERRFLRQRSDRPGAVRLPFAEDDLGILMCITLIISREIQVDIGLFISLKSKERLKRNIKSIFDKRLSTVRAYFIRHIPSTSSGKCTHFLRLKITVMTVGTVIMRAERVYLGNSRHRRHERRTDRTSGANKISILV